MNIETELDILNNIRMHRLTGRPNKKQILIMLGNIYSNPDFKPDMHSLWDFTHVDLTSLSIEDSDVITSFIEYIKPPALLVRL